jgi:hypothetical protein
MKHQQFGAIALLKKALITGNSFSLIKIINKSLLKVSAFDQYLTINLKNKDEIK